MLLILLSLPISSIPHSYSSPCKPGLRTTLLIRQIGAPTPTEAWALAQWSSYGTARRVGKKGTDTGVVASSRYEG